MNAQFLTLLVAVLNGQFGVVYFLSHRIDRVGDEVGQAKSDLSGRIESLRGELSGRIDRITDDLKVFYRDFGKHERRIDS